MASLMGLTGSWHWPWVSIMWPPVFQLARLASLPGAPRVAFQEDRKLQRLLGPRLQYGITSTRSWWLKHVPCPAQIQGGGEIDSASGKEEGQSDIANTAKGRVH